MQVARRFAVLAIRAMETSGSVENAFAWSQALAQRGLAVAMGPRARAVRGERCTKVQSRLHVAPRRENEGKHCAAQCCVGAIARALATC